MRRALTLLTSLTLLAGLAACGDQPASSDEGGEGAGLEAVTVSGDFGSEPEVTWNSAVSIDELEEDTLIEGDGETVADGDSVLTHLWIGNGFTRETAYSSWDDDAQQKITVDQANVNRAIYEAVSGHTVGSRVIVAAPPEDAFGETGNPTFGIGNDDDVVFVVDIMSKVLDGPEGAKQAVPKGTPRVVEKDGVPTGFDFSKSPKQPSGKLEVITLVKGTGPKIAQGNTTDMDYLGQIYGSTKVFDQTYATGEPASFQIGTGNLIKGWDEGLVGVPVGSRVILIVPPKFGYGEAGNDNAGIKGTDTLVFVVDVLATY